MKTLAQFFLKMIFSTPFKALLYWIKLLLSRMRIRLYRRFKENRLDFYDLLATAAPEKVGILVHPNEIEMEKPQPDSHLAKAEDSIFCYGVNSKSEFLAVSMSRLCNQKAEANICMKLSNGKTYRLVKTEDEQQALGDKYIFSCGGLQMYFTSVHRRWRIFYNGYLREESDDNTGSEKMVHVKFSLMWKASSDIFDGTADLNNELIAQSMARSDWKSLVPPVTSLHESMDFYAQAGIINGMVYVQDTFEDYELYLFGERIRSLENTSLTKEKEFCYVLGYIHEDGTFVHFGRASLKNIAEKLDFGFVVQPHGAMAKVTNLDMPSSENSDKERITAIVEQDETYTFSGSECETLYRVNSRGRFATISKVKFHLNGKKGTGVKIKGTLALTDSKSDSYTAELTEPVPLPDALIPMVVTFDDRTCQLSEVTGGKGSSLGKLTELSEDLQNFTVPRGVVVTTASYKSFITPPIVKEIANLGNILYGNTIGDVTDACKRVNEKIVRENIPSNIRDNIIKNLKKVFGDKYSSKKYAVRSSATGEDTEQMSAAGQMDTFLGVSGLNNILLAVKKCWASQFGTIAVQYKKRYGQILNSPMAVVIQEMVPCQTAGVIFTCDPLTGNPTTVTITANFGLGESVVSGSEEPDTIELTRDHCDNITLQKVLVGAKSRRIVMKGEGTDTEEVSEEDKRRCCLSEEDSLRLGRLAVQIEKYYRSKRDIEWGIKDRKIYMFQSRPVTSGSQETDYEIERESDNSLRIENDYFSVSNTGEVLPGAMSTLSYDLMFKAFSIPWQKERQVEWQTGIKTRFFFMGWMASCNHAMFCVCDLIRTNNPDEIDKIAQSTMVALFGRIIEEKEVFTISANRYKVHMQEEDTWADKIRMFKNLYLSRWRLGKAIKAYKNYRIPVEKYKTVKDLFYAIVRTYSELEESQMNHMACSQGSTSWTMNIISVLSQSKKSIDDEVYSDFSGLLTTSSGTESADVPAAIQELGISIGKCIKPSEFKAMKPEQALEWLKTTPTAAGKKFKEFLQRHGHRCFREFDMYYQPWEIDPMPVVKLLQNFAGNAKRDDSKKGSSILQLWRQINRLTVPLGFFDKLKLLIMVPFSRKAVQDREMSKSVLVKSMNAWRTAFWALAKRMVSEGFIPEEKVLFFMTLSDIKNILETRSPKILSKVYHRQRLYPKMDKYRFPELMRGIPKPISEDYFVVPDSDEYFSMKGIPVSQGVAKGYVRVAITVEEAAGLKPGEILIAYGTDIGWSPFFPILAGVCTELGGLISHGAVVSREYGLPCIAGLHGATRMFRTGDYVLLDGNKGILQKLPPPTDP